MNNQNLMLISDLHEIYRVHLKGNQKRFMRGALKEIANFA